MFDVSRVSGEGFVNAPQRTYSLAPTNEGIPYLAMKAPFRDDPDTPDTRESNSYTVDTLRLPTADHVFTTSALTMSATLTGDMSIDIPRILNCFNKDQYLSQYLQSAKTRSPKFKNLFPETYCTGYTYLASHIYESCFDSSSTVLTESGSLVPLRDLQPFDRVLVQLQDGSTAFDTVYFIQHHSRGEVPSWLFVLRTESSHEIRMSGSHFLQVSRGGCTHPYEDQSLLLASEVSVGDGLWVQGSPLSSVLKCSPVLTTQRVLARGVRNPLTLSGNVIVDGVAASTQTVDVTEEGLPTGFKHTFHVVHRSQAVFRLIARAILLLPPGSPIQSAAQCAFGYLGLINDTVGTPSSYLMLLGSLASILGLPAALLFWWWRGDFAATSRHKAHSPSSNYGFARWVGGLSSH